MKPKHGGRQDGTRAARPGAARHAADVARDPVQAGVLAQVLRALGHPARLRILAFLLGAAERTVNEIAAGLDMPQAVVSQHLSALRLHGLVRVRREGGFRHYSVALLMVGELVACMGRCYRLHASKLPQNVG